MALLGALDANVSSVGVLVPGMRSGLDDFAHYAGVAERGGGDGAPAARSSDSPTRRACTRTTSRTSRRPAWERRDPEELRAANPDVTRYSITAPSDPISAVQGSGFLGHGMDPDTFPGNIPLEVGRDANGQVHTGSTRTTWTT